MGREEDSRGTTQISRKAGHFEPTILSASPITPGLRFALHGWTNLSLSNVHANGSRGNFNWVRASAISPTALHISGGFRQPTFLCHSLDAVIIRRIRLLSSGMRDDPHPALAFGGIQGKIRLAQ